MYTPKSWKLSLRNAGESDLYHQSWTLVYPTCLYVHAIIKGGSSPVNQKKHGGRDIGKIHPHAVSHIELLVLWQQNGPGKTPKFRSNKERFWLVVPTPLKNISQIGKLSQVGVKIKHIWNHHLGFMYPWEWQLLHNPWRKNIASQKIRVSQKEIQLSYNSTSWATSPVRSRVILGGSSQLVSGL